MGNIISSVDLMADKQKISELEFDNQALKKQVNSLKEIIQKEGNVIAQQHRENKELERKNKELERENKEFKCKNEKDCVICHYLNN